MENKTTINELSGLWRVDDETIKRAIRILFPELMEMGKTTYLTEFHVAVIKEKVVENKMINLLFKESVDTSDDLAIIRGLQAAQRKIKKLDAQIAEISLVENETENQIYKTGKLIDGLSQKKQVEK